MPRGREREVTMSKNSKNNQAEAAPARKLTKVELGAKTRYVKTGKALTAEQIATDNYVALDIDGTVAGVLVSTFEDTYKKLNFVLEIADGSKIAIAGQGNLTRKMQEVPVGAYVEITYLGKTPMKSGPFKGTGAHGFNVAFEAIN